MTKPHLFGLLVAMAFSMIVSDMVNAQGGGRWRGFGNIFENSLNTLMRDEVIEELGLAEDQVEQLRGLQQEARNTMREVFRGRGEEGFDWNAVREEMAAKTKEMEEKINSEILLAHQVERLEQIVLQSRAQRGTTNALESVKEKLDISDEQMERIQAKAEEAQKEFQEAIAKAREAMEESIKSELSSEQRRKLEEMLGEKFEFQNRRFGRGGDNNRRGTEENRRGRNREDF